MNLAKTEYMPKGNEDSKDQDLEIDKYIDVKNISIWEIIFRIKDQQKQR